MVKGKVSNLDVLGLRGRGVTQGDIAELAYAHRVTVARVLSGRTTSGKLRCQEERRAPLADSSEARILRAVELVNQVEPAEFVADKQTHLARIREMVRATSEVGEEEHDHGAISPAGREAARQSTRSRVDRRRISG